MKKKTKPGAIQQLLSYAGNNKKQLYLSTFLATLGELFGMAPFITVSLLVAELFNKTATIQNVCILFAVALGGQILKLWLTYQSSFMSHKATYKILKNIRSKIADKMLRVPMGIMLDTPTGNRLVTLWRRLPVCFAKWTLENKYQICNSLYSSACVGASPSNSFIFRDNILFTKNFDYCTCFEYSISDYGNIGIDSSASGKSYPSSNCDTSGYHIEISSIFETRCALYKTRDENEGRGIVFLENSKSSGADIRRLFNPYTYAPSDDGDRIIRISGNARHQLSL